MKMLATFTIAAVLVGGIAGDGVAQSVTTTPAFDTPTVIAPSGPAIVPRDRPHDQTPAKSTEVPPLPSPTTLFAPLPEPVVPDAANKGGPTFPVFNGAPKQAVFVAPPNPIDF